MQSIKPFLTFQGQASEVLEFYRSVFPDFQIISQTRDEDNRIVQAEIQIHTLQIRIFDSPISHDWDFSPAISFFIETADREEIEELSAQLAPEGKVMMPLASYDFSPLFTWVEDKYGVNWQISLVDHSED